MIDLIPYWEYPEINQQTIIDAEQYTALELAAKTAHKTNEIIEAINNVSNDLLPSVLTDSENEDFGTNGNATYLNGRLVKWEQRTVEAENHFDNQIINVLFPPAPMVAVKANANYLKVSDHRYYKESTYVNYADDDTIAIQAIFDAAPIGTTILFTGKCRITGELLLPKPLNIIGKSKYNTGIYNDGVTNTIRVADTVERFAIRDICVQGNDVSTFAPASTTLSGIVFGNCYAWHIDNCWIRGHGEHGIKFNAGNYTSAITHTEIENNKNDGLFMVGVSSSNQMNGISVQNCHVSNNGRHGINLWGTNFNIVSNIIEGNKNSGIIISYDFVTGAYSCSDVTIRNNYFELNGDGFINTKSTNTGTIRTLSYLTIEQNYGGLSLAQVNAGVLYICNFTGTGSLSSTSLSNLKMSNNAFTGTGGLKIANFNNLLNESCVLELLGGSFANYVNLGGAVVNSYKRLTISGYFYAKGATYNTPLKSEPVSIPSDTYFPLPLRNYELLTKLGIYVETDHTAFTLKFKVFKRSVETIDAYTELFSAETLNKTASGMVWTNTIDQYGATDAKRLVSPMIDFYVVVNIVSASGGSFLRLGNLTVQYC